ncbi:hypothetical protein KKH3_36840 [Pectobacterium actinidiae]|nr:hypothetical protein KKH3_36840 [Pectobacterium actinidiae]
MKQPTTSASRVFLNMGISTDFIIVNKNYYRFLSGGSYAQ